MTYAQAYYGVGGSGCRIDAEVVAYAQNYFGDGSDTNGVCVVDTDCRFSLQSVSQFGDGRIETTAGVPGLIDRPVSWSLQGVTVFGVRNIDAKRD